MLVPIILPIIVIGTVLLFFWLLYNGLVTKKLRVDEAWSQIEVQLQRRADLVPNLVEAVKGYVKHEKGVFEEVTKARSTLVSAKSPADKAEANNRLAGALKTLFAVAEAYPKLEASQNFKELQEELTDTEDKVAYSRQFYNTVVLEYNTSLKIIPAVLFAGSLGFKPAEFFDAGPDEEVKKPVKVSF